LNGGWCPLHVAIDSILQCALCSAALFAAHRIQRPAALRVAAGAEIAHRSVVGAFLIRVHCLHFRHKSSSNQACKQGNERGLLAIGDHATLSHFSAKIHSVCEMFVLVAVGVDVAIGV
jgi:hypothetical protein